MVVFILAVLVCRAESLTSNVNNRRVDFEERLENGERVAVIEEMYFVISMPELS